MFRNKHTDMALIEQVNRADWACESDSLPVSDYGIPTRQ